MGVRLRCGPISTDSVIEVLASEADRYPEIDHLTFSAARQGRRVHGNDEPQH